MSEKPPLGDEDPWTDERVPRIWWKILNLEHEYPDHRTVNAAYHRLLLQYHPDKTKGEVECRDGRYMTEWIHDAMTYYRRFVREAQDDSKTVWTQHQVYDYQAGDEMLDDEAGAEMEDDDMDKQPLTVVGANLCQRFTEQFREVLSRGNGRFLARQYEAAAKLDRYQEELCLKSIRKMEAGANDQDSDNSFVQHGLSSADESMNEEMDVETEKAQDRVEVGEKRQVTGEASPACKKPRQDESIVISSDEEIPETPSD